MERPEPEYVGFDDGLDWEEADEPVTPGDDGRRVRRVRALVVACVLGGLVIVALGVFGTRVLVDELREPTAHERTVNSIQDRARDRYEACLRRGTDAAVCASRAAAVCQADPRWTLDDLAEIETVCVFSRAD